MAGVLERNIQALLERKESEGRALAWQDRIAEKVTDFTGSIAFVYLHVALYGFWIVANLGWIPGVPKFDKTFVILAMEASVEAIFLSTFILITQNRMMAQADKRADLNLQISLLAEHEVTRLLQLVREIATKLDLPAANQPELDALEKDVAPEQVLDTIERQTERVERERANN
jgi:uncharacterized membrane protein